MLFVTGCASTATGQLLKYSSLPLEQKSHITHYRLGSGYGGAVTEYLYSNENFVTHIIYEGYYKEVVDPGVYEYRKLLRWDGILSITIGGLITNADAKIQPSITLRAEPKKEYFIRWEIEFGEGLVPVMVAKEIALNELKGLKQFEFNGKLSDAETLLKERSSD